jgi:hypothetical protein
MKKQWLFLFAAGLISITACKQNGTNLAADATPATQQSATERAVALMNETVKMDENPFKTSTSELLSDDDFVKIFGQEGKKSLNRINRENYCLMEWLKADWVQRDNQNDKTGDKFSNPKNNLILHLIPFGQAKIAKSIFDQKIELRTEQWNDKIDGIGEGALWSSENRQLIVLAGQFIAYIGVSVEDDATANLPKAKEVAAVVIPKLSKK